MIYDGKIEKCIEKKRTKINFSGLLWWYLGIIISLFPLGIDAIKYVIDNNSLDMTFCLKCCLKGDLLWILATIIIFSVIDYANDSNRIKSKASVGLIILGAIFWGASFAIWCLLKYGISEDYSGKFPIYLDIVIWAVGLIYCTPLHVKIVEVEK